MYINKFMPKQFTTADFIKRANNVHDNFYDYTQVLYTNMHTKVKIIDPEYGVFWQVPHGHINQKQGHPLRGKIKAADTRRTSLDDFITLAREKHGDLYDYSKVEYTHCDNKILIIDPEYGEFWQSPYQHLNSHGCPARTADKKWLIHLDHVVPLSIIYSHRRQHSTWSKDRPLYKFLNSDINLRPVKSKFNNEKSDHVTINGKVVNAASVRNNYDVIAYLIKTELNIDPTNLIEEDRMYVQSYLGI